MAAVGVGPPRVGGGEPLGCELRAFVRAMEKGTPLLTPGEDGARVVRVMEAARASLEQGGREIALRIR